MANLSESYPAPVGDGEMRTCVSCGICDFEPQNKDYYLCEGCIDLELEYP